MKIICVGGISSNCGKTAVACMLLKALPGWAAVKVTPSRHEEECPRGHDCSACRPPDSRYEIITDTDILSLEGKDTARYINCGAEKVVWVRALPEHLSEALDATLGHIADTPGVIIESTTAFQFIKGLHIMVTQQGTTGLKESAHQAEQYVDLVALNMELKGTESFLLENDVFVTCANLPKRAPSPLIPLIPVCAMLPPEHPVNQQFVDHCISRIGVLDGSENHAV